MRLPLLLELGRSLATATKTPFVPAAEPARTRLSSYAQIGSACAKGNFISSVVRASDNVQRHMIYHMNDCIDYCYLLV